MGLEIERDEESSLILDDRYFPILITRWAGKPTLALADAYFRWHDTMVERAEFYETKVVHMTDANAAEQPDAPVRKFIADSSASRAKAAHVALNSYVTLESKLVRGVLTVIGWAMSDTKFNPIMTPNIEVALERALADLDAAKIERPRGLEPNDYTRSLGLAAAPPAPQTIAGAHQAQINAEASRGGS